MENNIFCRLKETDLRQNYTLQCIKVQPQSDYIRTL